MNWQMAIGTNQLAANAFRKAIAKQPFDVETGEYGLSDVGNLDIQNLGKLSGIMDGLFKFRRLSQITQ